MRLVKTLANGNKVYEAVEGKVPALVRIEKDASGKEVKRWAPKFAEIAGGSAASKQLGR